MKDKNKIKIYEKPKKLILTKSSIIITCFISGLALLGLIICFVVFWNNIINFLGKSGGVIILILLLLLCVGIPALIISKIVSHDKDKF